MNRPTAADCAVVELRQYTLHPRQRDALISLFDREFVETQEAAGMNVLGQFRDLDDPDRFVWLRGFAEMAQRRAALAAFYGGPVWAAHADAANATMVSSDDVLLLRPAWPGAGFVPRRQRAVPTSTVAAAGLLEVTVWTLREPAGEELLAAARGPLSWLLAQGGASALGWYVTEPSPNDFPRLPVREGEHVLVGLALFDSPDSFAAFRASRRWDREAAPLLRPWLARPEETRRLVPTARSAIRA